MIEFKMLFKSSIIVMILLYCSISLAGGRARARNINLRKLKKIENRLEEVDVIKNRIVEFEDSLMQTEARLINLNEERRIENRAEHVETLNKALSLQLNILDKTYSQGIDRLNYFLSILLSIILISGLAIAAVRWKKVKKLESEMKQGLKDFLGREAVFREEVHLLTEKNARLEDMIEDQKTRLEEFRGQHFNSLKKMIQKINKNSALESLKEELDDAVDRILVVEHMKKDLSAYDLNKKAFGLYKKADYDDALYYYGKSLEIDTEIPETWHNLGLVYTKLGRHDDALNAYNMAIKFKPDHAPAWYNKGLVHKKLKSYDESLNAYNKAVSINPEYSITWNKKRPSVSS